MARPDEVKRYYSEIERYDWVTEPRRLSKIYHSCRGRESLKLVTKHSRGGTMLDVGCGTGLITRGLGAELVVGLDINHWAIGRAMVHASGVDFVVGDAESLPLGPDLFDMVVCTEVLEHLPRPARAVQEAFRVLKPGGLLVGSVPSSNPIWRLRRRLSSRGLFSEPFHSAYGASQLRLLLRDFQIIGVTYMACCLVLAFVARKP